MQVRLLSTHCTKLYSYQSSQWWSNEPCREAGARMSREQQGRPPSCCRGWRSRTRCWCTEESWWWWCVSIPAATSTTSTTATQYRTAIPLHDCKSIVKDLCMLASKHGCFNSTFIDIETLSVLNRKVSPTQSIDIAPNRNALVSREYRWRICDSNFPAVEGN